jgi:hypothetical protein
MQGTMDRPLEAKGGGWREARAVGFRTRRRRASRVVLEVFPTYPSMLYVGMKLGEKDE